MGPVPSANVLIWCSFYLDALLMKVLRSRKKMTATISRDYNILNDICLNLVLRFGISMWKAFSMENAPSTPRELIFAIFFSRLLIILTWCQYCQCGTMPGFAGVIVLMLPPIIDNQTLLSSTLLVKQKTVNCCVCIMLHSVCKWYLLVCRTAVAEEPRFSDAPVWFLTLSIPAESNWS